MGIADWMGKLGKRAPGESSAGATMADKRALKVQKMAAERGDTGSSKEARKAAKLAAVQRSKADKNR